MAIMMTAVFTHKSICQTSINTQIANLIYATDTTIDYPYKHPSPGFIYKPYNIFNTSDASLRRANLNLIKNLYDSISFGLNSNIANSSLRANGAYIQQWAGYPLNFDSLGAASFKLDSVSEFVIKSHNSNGIFKVTDTGTKPSVIISGVRYPVLDGTYGQSIVTNGSGKAFFGDLSRLGLINTYNSISTQGTGFPVILKINDLTAQTSSIGSFISYTAPVNETFIILSYINCTSVSGGSVTSNISFTDVNGNVHSMVVCGTVNSVVYDGGRYITIRAKGGTALVISTTVVGTITYDLGASIIWIN